MNAIETRALSKKFKDKLAVDGLDLNVPEGELYALLGVNGAGKTTTIRMLCCLIGPTSGDALLKGNSIKTDPFNVKRIINVSPQETAVARNLTVNENLMMIAGVYGAEKAEAASRTQEMLNTFKLAESADKKAKVLSGGQQRRLSIAMALITRPEILFLDEPTLGLDVLARRELWAAIKRLKGKVTTVLTTHYMEEAEALADKIGIMSGGKLIMSGTAAEIMTAAGTKTLEDAFIALAGEKEAAV